MHHHSDMRPDEAKISGAFAAIEAAGCSYSLLGDYPHLPRGPYAHDIDLVVSNLRRVEHCLRDSGWVVRRATMRRTLHAYTLSAHGGRWITLDILGTASIREAQLLTELLNTSQRDANTGISQPASGNLLAWRSYKRLSLASFRSPKQLAELAEAWRVATEIDVKVALRLLKTAKMEPKLIVLLKSIWRQDHLGSDITHQLLSRTRNQRANRNKKRYILDGYLLKQNILISKMGIVTLAHRVKHGANPVMLTVAIVGNDGSGKTRLIKTLKQDLILKADPLHIIMRRDEPHLPTWRIVRPRITALLKRKINKKRFSQVIASFLQSGVEVMDYFDRRVRHVRGQLWANAGLGITLYERYPTDRIRGEYVPSSRNLLPLEQFFPMPDLVILLDATEATSLARKPLDNHTKGEMASKRANYLRLVDQIKPSEVVSAELSPEEVAVEVSRLIWNYARLKQEDPTKFPGHWAKKTGLNQGIENG